MSYRCKKKIWVNDHWANSMIMKDQVFKFIWASATLLNMYIVSIYTCLHVHDIVTLCFLVNVSMTWWGAINYYKKLEQDLNFESVENALR